MALDIARLGFVVDSAPLKQATSELNRFGNEAGKVDRTATRAAANINRSFSTNMAAVRAMAYRAAGAMGALAGAVAAASIVHTSDQYVEMTNGLRVLGLTAEEAADRLNQIGDIARRTRTPLQATSQLYQRVSIASRELGATQEDVLRFTENVGLALAQQGGSAESASGALMQLSQALAGGVVRAEEFNSILEGAFPIAQAAADGIDAAGGSIGRLRKLMLDGQVTSKMFFDAILSQTTKLSAAFAGTVPTVGQAMQVLRDQWTLAVGQMSGGTSALSTAILRLADGVSVAAGFIGYNMNQIMGVFTATAAAVTVYYTPAIYGAIKAVTLFGASLVTLRGAMIATGIGAMVVAAGLLIGKILDLRQATGSWGGALSALGDLAGLVWQGIIDSAGAIPPGLEAVWALMRAGFYNSLVSMGNTFKGWIDNIAAMSYARFPGISDALVEVSGNISASLNSLDASASKAMQDAQDAGKGVAKIIGDAFAPVGAAMEKLNALKDETLGSPPGMPPGTPPGTPPGAGGAKGGAGAKSETEKAADKAREALGKLRGEHAALQATLGMTEVQERAYRAAMDLGAGATAAQRAEVQALIPEISRLEQAQQAIRDQAQQMQQGFRDMFTGIVSGAESARDAVSNLLSKMADMMANGAFDALWGGFGRRDPLSAALSAIPGLATGGHVKRGGWAMVGERGPELVNLPSRATVYDNGQTRQAVAGGGGGTTNVHVTVGFDERSGNLTAFVDQRVSGGLRQADRAMSGRVAQINRDPLKR